MKTIAQWLSELPDGYRERAEKNLQDSKPYTGDSVHDCMPDALSDAFVWHETPEGHDFWDAVSIYHLPPLPETGPKPNEKQP
jgi:hypothetical protein